MFEVNVYFKKREVCICTIWTILIIGTWNPRVKVDAVRELFRIEFRIKEKKKKTKSTNLSVFCYSCLMYTPSITFKMKSSRRVQKFNIIWFNITLWTTYEYCYVHCIYTPSVILTKHHLTNSLWMKLYETYPNKILPILPKGGWRSVTIIKMTQKRGCRSSVGQW